MNTDTKEHTKPVTAQEALEALNGLGGIDCWERQGDRETVRQYIEQNKHDAGEIGEPSGWERKWSFDNETPIKHKNENGRMEWPLKFKLLPITKYKCLDDDVPLYTTPPTAQAYAALMLHKTAELCSSNHMSWADTVWNEACNDCAKAILALIPTDAQAALDDYVREIAMEVAEACGVGAFETIPEREEYCRAIVNSVIEGKKG